MTLPKENAGYSLIELLIVIAIIAIISAVMTGFSVLIQKNTRDAQRQSDIRVIQSALQQYYADINKYPNELTELTTGNAITNCSGRGTPCTVNKTYLTKTPKDPSGTNYFYEPRLNVTTATTCSISGGVENGSCYYYFLCAKLENPASGSTCSPSSVNYNFQINPL